MLANSLKEKGFRIVEKIVADDRLASHVGLMQLSKVSEDGLWFLGWLNCMMRSFNVFFLLIDVPDKPEWTFIRNTSQSPDATDR